MALATPEWYTDPHFGYPLSDTLCSDCRISKLKVERPAYARVGLFSMQQAIHAQGGDITMPKVRKLSVEEVQRLAAAQRDQEAGEMPHSASPDSPMLENAYPHIAAWVDGGGWIELGQNEYSRSFIRILDIGGMLWEGTTRYISLDALFHDAEEALIRLAENGDI
jgi:hypothetical protein